MTNNGKKSSDKAKNGFIRIFFSTCLTYFIIFFGIIALVYILIGKIITSGWHDEYIPLIIPLILILVWTASVSNVEIVDHSNKRRSHSLFTIQQLDAMEGHAFEYAVADILRENGYSRVYVTVGSGDYGVDVVATDKSGAKVAIQCKRFVGTVGVKAVQEVRTGMDYYDCQKCMVITNSGYTKQAIKLANKVGVTLVGRRGLISMLEIANEQIERLNAETEKENLEKESKAEKKVDEIF